MVELLNCPFCGGKAEITHGTSGDYYGVGCLVCGATIYTDVFLYRDDAINAWNRRVNKEENVSSKIENRIIKIHQDNGDISYRFGRVEFDGKGNIIHIFSIHMEDENIEDLLQKYESLSEVEYKKIIVSTKNGYKEVEE